MRVLAARAGSLCPQRGDGWCRMGLIFVVLCPNCFLQPPGCCACRLCSCNRSALPFSGSIPIPLQHPWSPRQHPHPTAASLGEGQIQTLLPFGLATAMVCNPARFFSLLCVSISFPAWGGKKKIKILKHLELAAARARKLWDARLKIWVPLMLSQAQAAP